MKSSHHSLYSIKRIKRQSKGLPGIEVLFSLGSKPFRNLHRQTEKGKKREKGTETEKTRDKIPFLRGDNCML